MKLEIFVSEEIAKALTLSGEALGTSAKEEAEALLRSSASRHRRTAEEFAKRAGQLWRDAAPYLPYASYLVKPGAAFRVKDRVLRQADWQPIQDQLSQVFAALAARGWSRARVERFLVHARSSLKSSR